MTDVQVILSAIIRWHHRDGNELRGQQAVIVPDEWPDGEVVTVVRGVVPDGLHLGPVVDGVQTYYGMFSAIPEGWQYRYYEDDEWDVQKRPTDSVSTNIIQCRPPQPRTELVPLTRALGRRLPNGDLIWCVVDKGTPYSDTNAPYYKAGDNIAAIHTHDALHKFPGKVEVLIEDDQ